MARKIAGITVEIGGDTLKLNKALGEVQTKIKQTTNELKDVEKLLKLDPHNTELLTQKQKLLKDAIQETKEKLETLRTAEKQAQADLANGNISEKQFDALKREIIATEGALEKFNKELKNTDSISEATLKNLGGKFTETGEKITSVGKTLSQNVTAPIIAVGAASTIAFNEVDVGYDTIIKKTGATGEALKSLQSVADNIFKKLPVEMNDVGVAVGEVNTRFKVTGEELQTLSELFIKFSQINETDLNNSIAMSSKIMTQWGIDTKETANVLGLLTQKSQDTGISVDNLMNGVQQYGSVLKEMGLNLVQSINLLSQFEENGVNADQAMMGLKKAVAAYTKDGLSMDEALKKTIESIKTASTETEALKVATSIFGSKGATEMTKAIREGRFSIDDLSKSMSEYKNVVGNTFEATQDGVDKFQVASNNAKLALAQLGEAISDVLGPILQSVADMFGSLASWLSGLNPTVKQFIVIIGLVVAAIGPLLVIFGTLFGAIGNIINGVAAISGAFSAISGVMAGIGGAVLPILGVVAAVVSLVAIGSYLKEHWSEIKEFFLRTWQGIKEYFINIWEEVKQTLIIVWEVIKVYFTTTFTSLKTTFITIWEGIKLFFETIWIGLKTTVITIIEIIKTVITTYWDTIFTITGTIWSAIKEIISTIWSGISSLINSVITTISNLISSTWNKIQNTISTILNNISSTISTIWNSIYSIITNIVSNIYNYVSQIFNNMLSAISNIIVNISSTIQNGFKVAVDYIFGLIKSSYTWGSDLISGLVQGIKNKISAVVDAVKGVADTIWSYLHFSVPEVGPLTDYESWMPDFIKGLSKTLDNSRGILKSSVKRLSQDLVLNPSSEKYKIQKLINVTQSNSDISKLLSKINLNNNVQDITIPVYLGGNLLDEIIVNTQRRQIIKSGGR